MINLHKEAHNVEMSAILCLFFQNISLGGTLVMFSLSLFFKENAFSLLYIILFYSELILSLSAEGRRPDGSCKNRDERQ